MRQEKPYAKVNADLMQKVPVWMKEYKVPVVGVSLIEDGKIKQLKVFGALQRGKAAPVNSLFNIASQTKPITTALALKLIDQGQ